MAEIHTAISAIISEIGHIGKDKKNTQQGFMFRGIDQVMNTMKPLLAKHGVFIVPEVIDRQREERQTSTGKILIYSILTIKHHFIATDGSEVCSVTVGEGMDSADKASNKAMAIAFKYACFQVFCIPTEDMAKDDPDGYSPEPTTAVKPFDPFECELRINACTTTDQLKEVYNSLSDANKLIMKATFSQRKAQIAQIAQNQPKKQN